RKELGIKDFTNDQDSFDAVGGTLKGIYRMIDLQKWALILIGLLLWVSFLWPYVLGRESGPAGPGEPCRKRPFFFRYLRATRGHGVEPLLAEFPLLLAQQLACLRARQLDAVVADPGAGAVRRSDVGRAVGRARSVARWLRSRCT